MKMDTLATRLIELGNLQIRVCLTRNLKDEETDSKWVETRYYIEIEYIGRHESYVPESFREITKAERCFDVMCNTLRHIESVYMLEAD